MKPALTLAGLALHDVLVWHEILTILLGRDGSRALHTVLRSRRDVQPKMGVTIKNGETTAENGDASSKTGWFATGRNGLLLSEDLNTPLKLRMGQNCMFDL